MADETWNEHRYGTERKLFSLMWNFYNYNHVHNGFQLYCKLHRAEFLVWQSKVNKLQDCVKWKQMLLNIYSSFNVIVDQYQEQPHLLDPHLESLINQLLEPVRNADCPADIIHLTFQFFYLLTKTRGYKVIVRLMPHEVADVEPVLALLAKQDKTDHQKWEVRYMLLLWLSMVCMIPFDMVRLDSNVASQSGETKLPIMERIIQAGRIYLDVSDMCRDAAAYMLSRFMTRPDVRKEKLPEFLDWCIKVISEADMQTMPGVIAASGVLRTLTLLLKHGRREDLVTYAPVLFEKSTSLKFHENKNTVLRKLGSKLVQRLGLTFLKSRIAAWRYQRGSRSIADNLAPSQPKKGRSTLNPDEEDDEYDIPDELEDIIELLLTALKDGSTVVRWSAAKGIGRVTGRLPKELADEVVASIMELFTIAETDAAWHGGCMALAELGRRGLLLPQRLPEVVPVIVKALGYDEKRGNFSVGAHVRDAACYVCWAFARAYEPEDMKPYVTDIANALVIVSIFDREVNVRRAAAAAFQENVGRQGQFPHGIDILTTCDYFAVGNRINCYLELSVYVAQFPEYTQALIDHLAKVKTSHWDIAVRELTADGLHNLTPSSPEYMAQTVLPQLASLFMTIDLNQRHSVILCAAEVTYALAKLAKTQNKHVVDLIGTDSTESLRHIAEKLQEAKLFRGYGGELMRKAVCCLIGRLSLSKMPFHNHPVLDTWQSLIDDCLEHLETEIQEAAIKAIPAFVSEYYREPSGEIKQQKQDELINKYLKMLKSNVEATRIGYSLALGALPKFILMGKLKVVMQSLTEASCITEKEKKWAEARRAAILAFTSICVTVGITKSGSPAEALCVDNILSTYEVFFSAMKDYTLASKGDIGAWVREASMSGLLAITSLIVKSHPEFITPQISKRIFCNLIQQASEKIDRTRAHAGDVFCKLLYHDPEIPHVPHREDLQRIFPRNKMEALNWAVPAATFHLVTQILDLPTYTYAVLLGLTVSVGGLTESLVMHSADSLMKYLRNTNKKKLEEVSRQVLSIFKDHLKQDRVTLPMLKMVDQLLAGGCFNSVAEEEGNSFPTELHALCKKEITRCTEPQKLLASIEVFCGLLQFPGEVKKKSLQQLVIFLCHKYPLVRKTTASKLYEAVVTFDGLVDDEILDDVMTVLSDTQWDEPVNTVRPIRNKLCDIMNVPCPVITKAPAKVQKQEIKGVIVRYNVHHIQPHPDIEMKVILDEDNPRAMKVVMPALWDIPEELHGYVTRPAHETQPEQTVRDVAEQVVGLVPTNLQQTLKEWNSKDSSRKIRCIYTGGIADNYVSPYRQSLGKSKVDTTSKEGGGADLECIYRLL